MQNDDVIETLNDLIHICNDGAEGFTACAENAKISSANLKNIFYERARECGQATSALSALVAELGGTPTSGGTIAGSLHRGWLNVKTAIAGKNDRAVLEECERGEDVAKAAYQRALTRTLPDSIRSVVEHQYQGVLKNHALIKKLRDEAIVAQS